MDERQIDVWGEKVRGWKMAARGREGERMEDRHLSQEPVLLPVK